MSAEADDPTTAGQPGRRGATRTYDRDGLTVEWDASLCIHTARCIAAAPAVFDPRRKPWVDLSAGTSDEIADAVRRCPTGALRYRSTEDTVDADAPAPAVEVRPDGPLYVRGDVVLEGAAQATGSRFALCRCGATGNPPYCDNSHKAVGFTARENARHESTGATPGERVVVRVPDEPGPYRLSGAPVVTPSGDVLDDGAKCFLCRCGLSRSKPFCDSSHKALTAPAPDGDA